MDIAFENPYYGIKKGKWQPKVLVDDIKYRPPIFRKKTENEEKCANFKGKIQFYREIQL